MKIAIFACMLMCAMSGCVTDDDLGLDDTSELKQGLGAICNNTTTPPFKCKGNKFCQFNQAQQCGDNGENGICVAFPDDCPTEVATVCGCDDETYDNACLANEAGTAVRHDGACL